MKLFYVGIFISICWYSTAVHAQTTTDAVATSSTEITSNDTAIVPTATVSNNGRTTLPPLAQTRITNLTANISNRLDATARRLTNIANRLESRATKLDSEGLDTTTARTKLAEARAALTEAEIALVRIDADVAAFVGSETPRERWLILKETYQGISRSIRSAHQALVDTLLLLRTATTTPTPTDSPREVSDVE